MYRARNDRGEFIVVDGKPGPEFDKVSKPVANPDGTRIAYWATLPSQGRRYSS